MFVTIRLEDPLVLQFRKDCLSNKFTGEFIADTLANYEDGFFATEIEIGGLSQTNISFVNDSGLKFEAGYFMDAKAIREAKI